MTHTPTTVFVIGGIYTRKVVAQFSKNRWHRLPDLQQQRLNHGSIRMGSQAIVVGGFQSGVESSITELWNFETGRNEAIEPTLLPSEYSKGIALYVVDSEFCKK